MTIKFNSKELSPMTSIFESKKVCATMFILLALSLTANKFAGGSLPSFGASPIVGPEIQQKQQLADGPFFPPDPYDDEDSTVAQYV